MESQGRHDRLLGFVLETLEDLKQSSEIPADAALHPDAPLIGEGGIIDSRSLVELLIALEEFIEDEYGAKFDWTSDRAMSAKNSPFRTPTTLVEFALGEASQWSA